MIPAEGELLRTLTDPRLERAIAGFDAAKEFASLRYRVLGLAVAHRAVGNLARTFDSIETSGSSVGARVPRDFRHFLVTWQEGNIAHNRRLLRAGSYACDALIEAGIDCAIRKGPGLCWSAYGDLSTRVMGDIDVVVAPDAAGDACAAIAAFASSRYSSTLNKRDRTLLALTPLRDVFGIEVEGRMVEVEVADRILPRTVPVQFDLGAALSAAEFVEVPGMPRFPQFSMIDLFLDVCGHLYEDAKSVSSIKWGKDLMLGKFADLAALVPRTEVEPRELAHRIRDAGMTDVAFFSLSVVEDIWPGTIPAGLLAAIPPSDPAIMRTYGEVERERYEWDVERPVDRMFMAARSDVASGNAVMYDTLVPAPSPTASSM